MLQHASEYRSNLKGLWKVLVYNNCWATEVQYDSLVLHKELYYIKTGSKTKIGLGQQSEMWEIIYCDFLTLRMFCWILKPILTISRL